MTKKSVVHVTIPPYGQVEDFSNGVVEWFEKNGRKYPWRRKGLSQYHLVVTEILLQRTRADIVADFETDFFLAYPTWKALANARKEELEFSLGPIGLWRRRAQGLILLANTMVSRREIFPEKREDTEALPAVGQYIANAILLLCKGQVEPLLDINMARVLERYFGPRQLADIRYDPYLQDLSRMVVYVGDAKDVNWGILDLAATVCRRHVPLCEICPVSAGCRSVQFSNSKT